jgi:hypothetical protein
VPHIGRQLAHAPGLGAGVGTRTSRHRPPQRPPVGELTTCIPCPSDQPNWLGTLARETDQADPVSLIDSAHSSDLPSEIESAHSSDLSSEIEIVGDRARWTAVCRDQLPPLGDPFVEG